jgi:hypothetical protein
MASAGHLKIPAVTPIDSMVPEYSFAGKDGSPYNAWSYESVIL